MKLAILADVHGNALALAAVLDDLVRHDVDQVINLGDAFNGPIDPVGVARLLRSRAMLHVRGNGERMVLDDDPDDRSESASFARTRLGPETLDWIRSWPETLVWEDIFACHGSPASDEGYLLDDPLGTRVGLRPTADIAGDLVGIDASLVLCGHTHLPRLVRLPSGITVLNPGSAGLPAYSLSQPVAHSMQAGCPHACYATAERFAGQWRVAHHFVPYDFEQAATLAEQAGFPEWAEEVRTGYSPGN